MKKIAIAVCFVGLLSAQFAVGAGTDDVSIGKELFANVCSRCHGAEGQGAAAPKLKGRTSAEVLQKLEGYRNGTYGADRKHVMEDMTRQRTPEELRAAAAFVGTLKP